MKVKAVDIKDNLMVINPITGHIGIYKGDFEGGVFLGTKRDKISKVVPVEVSKEYFLEWELAGENEKITVNKIFNNEISYLIWLSYMELPSLWIVNFTASM